MLFQALSEGLYSVPLRANLSIQANGKAYYKPLRLCFVNQALNRRSGLSLITRDVQCCIRRCQESRCIAYRYANSGLAYIQRHQSCHALHHSNEDVLYSSRT